MQTLGCKVNQYESQAMREILVQGGFEECVSKESADIYILNTCTVTQHADSESRHLIGLFHKANAKARTVVTGCYAEKNSDELLALAGVTYVLKNDEKNRIAEILSGFTENPARAPETLSITDFKGHSKAFIKIQDGCENFCSYCKVPLVRNRLNSKPIKDIVREVDALVGNGFKEIVLTGICIGNWGRDLFSNAIAKDFNLGGLSLVDVLKSLGRMDSDFRVRISSVEPKYVTDELIDLISKNKRFCKHLHIPLQSGDDEILHKMKRPYTANDYKAIIEKVRNKIEDVAITTDVLVGFPGETETHFKNTLNFIKDIQPARTHIFTFSKRPGTAAYNMPGEVSGDVLKKRYHGINVAALSASYLYRRRFIGKALEVLVETKRDRHSGLLTGYTDNYIKILFEGDDSLMKEMHPVKIEDINLAYTRGIYEPA